MSEIEFLSLISSKWDGTVQKSTMPEMSHLGIGFENLIKHRSLNGHWNGWNHYKRLQTDLNNINFSMQAWARLSFWVRYQINGMVQYRNVQYLRWTSLILVLKISYNTDHQMAIEVCWCHHKWLQTDMNDINCAMQAWAILSF